MRAQLETEMTKRTMTESKTTSLLDIMLQKVQNTETRSGQVEIELQEQRKEMKELGIK